MKLGHILIVYILISLCFRGSIQAQPCQDIQLDNYRYNLHTLNDVIHSNVYAPPYLVTLSLCKLKQSIFNDSYKPNGYGYYIYEGIKLPTSSNQTGPLKEYYRFIDDKKPDKGIQFNYVPFFADIMIDNVSLTATTTTKIMLECTSTNKQPNCTFVRGQNNFQVYFTCNVYAKEGCPELAINSFWKFLKNNSIIFAIVLWICALFLLVFGYLAIRMTILLYGIFTGSFFGVLVIAESYENFYLQSNGIFIFTVCLSVFLGLLFGITLLTIPKLGYVNIGIIVAAIFSLLLQNSFLYLTGSLLAFYITFGVVGLIMAIIALMELKNFVIVCSSFTGAFLFIRPLGFFLTGYPNQLISGKKFLISVQTPWQFYLYLVSILILTILGIIIQHFINKKISKHKAGASGSYYLEEQGTIKQKLKKLFEFKQIKDLANAGKLQFLQLKNIISQKNKKVDFDPAQFGQSEQDQGQYIQMQKMQKMQEKQRQSRKKQKQKFIAPSSQKGKKNPSQQFYPDDLQSIPDSDSIQTPKQTTKRNKN